MYKRMLRAVVATAFSAALACGVLAAGGAINQAAAPAGSAAVAAGAGDIAWNAVESGDIAWDSAAKGKGQTPTDIAWGTPAGTGA
jgi:hypothetical protein